MKLTCNNCGRVFEPLPIECGYSISINSETNQWECYLKDRGMISFENFLCEKCCKDNKCL
jgi:hypothetical protein